jgi:hypothetical protein
MVGSCSWRHHWTFAVASEGSSCCIADQAVGAEMASAAYGGCVEQPAIATSSGIRRDAVNLGFALRSGWRFIAQFSMRSPV